MDTTDIAAQIAEVHAEILYWCKTCQRQVPEGDEHDYQAHGSSLEHAEGTGGLEEKS